MSKVVELNEEIKVTQENMDVMITELLERNEFNCTGNVCGGDACGLHQINI